VKLGVTQSHCPLTLSIEALRTAEGKARYSGSRISQWTALMCIVTGEAAWLCFSAWLCFIIILFILLIIVDKC